MFKKGLLTLLATLVAAAIGAVSALASPPPIATAPWVTPPLNVFTCDWIAAHPTAADHWMVSCSDVPPPSVGDASVMSAGSSIASTRALASRLTFRPLANGCQNLPYTGGKVSTNVYAWSTYEYATAWQFGWPAGSALHWYLQKTDGTNYLNGDETSTTQVQVPGQIYRWGAQNQGYDPIGFWVCYS